jgi:hypothetical protein
MNPDHIPADVPFSLVCEDCDGGMEIRSYEEAIRMGWTDITYTLDLPMANFLGVCPDCRQRRDDEERRLRENHSL